MRKHKARRFRGILWVAAVAAGVLLVGYVGLCAYLAYTIEYPSPIPEDAKPSHYLLAAVDVSWSSSRGRDIKGWWTEGRPGAPAVLLAPGHDLSRSDALSLAAELGKRGFHSLIYSAGGRSDDGSKPAGILGPEAVEDMLSALDFVERRKEVASGRLGIWGVDVGARAALEAACRRPEVKAVAADSPYDAVADFVRLHVIATLGRTDPRIESGCLWILSLLEGVPADSFRAGLELEALANRSVLFITGGNRPELAQSTEGLRGRLKPEKELLSLAGSRARLMSAEMMAVYDRRVGDFFSTCLLDVRPGAGRQSGRTDGEGNQ